MTVAKQRRAASHLMMKCWRGNGMGMLGSIGDQTRLTGLPPSTRVHARTQDQCVE